MACLVLGSARGLSEEKVISTDEAQVRMLRNAVTTKSAEISELKMQIARLRAENQWLRKALSATGIKVPKLPRQEKKPKEEVPVKAGADPTAEVLALLVSRLADVENAETSLQRMGVAKKMVTEVNSKLSPIRFVLTHPIRDIEAEGKGYRVSLGPPREMATYSGYRYVTALRISLTKSQAAKVRPGDLLVTRSRAKLVLAVPPQYMPDSELYRALGAWASGDKGKTEPDPRGYDGTGLVVFQPKWFSRGQVVITTTSYLHTLEHLPRDDKGKARNE